MTRRYMIRVYISVPCGFHMDLCFRICWYNRPVSQIPHCMKYPTMPEFCNRNVHARALFCYKKGHYGIWNKGIVVLKAPIIRSFGVLSGVSLTFLDKRTRGRSLGTPCRSLCTWFLWPQDWQWPYIRALCTVIRRERGSSRALARQCSTW